LLAWRTFFASSSIAIDVGEGEERAEDDDDGDDDPGQIFAAKSFGR